MIYLKDGNIPLNEAWADEIYQEGNSTYQLTFKYPFSSDKWKLLTEETELIADDLHGEQEFTIFEVVKEQGYITVYANQIATLLKSYSISSINVDRVAGNVVMTELAGAILRDCPFSFYSDITDKHTFNAANISVMDALIKEKHSIVGQWGGDLVRDKYQVSLLKNGGSETEALFMYKKNMRSPQQTTSTKELRTRIHFRKKIEVGEGDNRKEQWLRVTVDSPLISKYKHIYEDDMEATDEDVKDLASLTKYGEQYYRTTLCDMIEDSLELDVAGVGDVPVKIFDVVSVYHEQFEIDVRKKITKYRYSPMGKRLKSVGFGTIQQTLGGALNALVSDSVKAETAIIEQDFEVKLEKELKNADKVFDQKMNQMEQSLSDEIEQARAKAEEVKAAITDQLNLKINQSKSEVTDRLQKEFDQKLSSASADLAGVRANLTQAQSRLSGDISQIQSDIAAIRGKQSQSDSELAKQAQSINQAKSELAGVKTNLTQAQNQLSDNISQIRSDVGAIRTKQAQTEAEINKQVAALNATKTELAGVKSAQATYEQTTTRRLAELVNVTDGKANRSELVQTATELSSKIASVQASGRNLFLNSLFKQDIRKTGIWTTSTYTAVIDSESKYLGHNALKIIGQDPAGKDGGNPKITYPATGQYGKVVPGSMSNQDVTISFYAKAEKAGTILRSRLGNIWFKDGNVTLTTEVKRYVVKFSRAWTGLSNLTTNEWLFNLNRADTVWIWMPKFEVSDTDTPYSEAPEDVENQISAVESSFKQKADSLEAGVSSLREGLKTKADSSALNLLSDRISASVKSLETDTQNNLNQKLSTAEFDVRASGIRQEIVNATKDKADKALVTAEAGRLREEFSKILLGNENLFVLKRSSSGYLSGGKNLGPAGIPNEKTSDFIAVTPDEKVTFQIWVTVPKGGLAWRAWQFYTKEKELLLTRQASGYEVVEGKQYARHLITVPANAAFIRLSARMYADGLVKVERSDVFSDWSPALEDADGLITEAKAVFERTAQGLRTDLTAIQSYVNADNTRAEALRTYSREETARQLTAERKLVEAGYVAKAQHTEDVRSISRRFEELKTSSETKLAEYRQTVEGQLANVQSALNTANGSLTSFNTWKQSAQETLNKVGRVESGLNETKTTLAEFKRTAEGQLSTITQQVAGKANQTEFKQKADSLEAGVNRLTEGLKTKADSSTLTVLSDSIKQSVKSLETDTQNKLDSKLSTAEFEVRASGIRQEIVNATKDKADKALVTAEAGRLREELASLSVGGRNLLRGSKGPFKPNRNPANFDNNVLYHNETSIYMVNGQRYRISAKTDGTFTSHHDGFKESDNVVLWITDKAVANYQIVSNAKTGTTGTEFTWNRPTGTYHLRVNTYRKDPEKLKSVWEVKVEQGSFKTDWSPATEDTDSLITEAKATFERTAQGLRTDLTAVQAYVNADGTRAEALRTFSREETARQLTALRQSVESDYVAKAQHTEDVRGLTRRFEELKTSSETKLAEYHQSVEGQFATISSQIGESLKKTDISITPGQITLGTGKVVNGQTLASLFVQNPESMQAITKLMRITGDLIVDGSITGRDLAAGAITTPHLAAGAVTAEVLGANAVTADKVKADDALLEKLSAGEALLRKLMAKDAFINKLQSIDFTAEQVKGGMIKALNGALKIDLNNGQYNVMTDQAAIRRVLNGYPNQFLKFTSETEGGAPASVTVLGANRDGTENSKNDSFAGIRLFSGNKVERTEIISDVVRFATGAVNYRGWEMRTLYGNDNRQVILQPFGNVTRSNIVANYFNGIDLVNVLETLNQMMANLGNHTGRHDIFGPIRGLGARKYAR